MCVWGGGHGALCSLRACICDCVIVCGVGAAPCSAPAPSVLAPLPIATNAPQPKAGARSRMSVYGGGLRGKGAVAPTTNMLGVAL